MEMQSSPKRNSDSEHLSLRRTRMGEVQQDLEADIPKQDQALSED